MRNGIQKWRENWKTYCLAGCEQGGMWERTRTRLHDVTSLMAVIQGRITYPLRQIAQATKSSTVWPNICVFSSCHFLGLQF
jgi:hypothetical protein